LKYESLEGWSIDAELGFPPMQAMGWTIDALPWRSKNVDWGLFDAVYIGTPWDYPEDPGHFMQVLESINRSSAVLVNDMALVSWSMSKTYLRDLEKMGVAIVPSTWLEQLEAGALGDAFDRFDVDKIIIKPVIGTNATDAYLVARQEIAILEPKLCETFANRPCVIQPFMENIFHDEEIFGSRKSTGRKLSRSMQSLRCGQRVIKSCNSSTHFPSMHAWTLFVVKTTDFS
jgi:hypothetical protein